MCDFTDNAPPPPTEGDPLPPITFDAGDGREADALDDESFFVVQSEDGWERYYGDLASAEAGEEPLFSILPVGPPFEPPATEAGEQQHDHDPDAPTEHSNDDR